MAKTIVAIMYDFDKTLCTKDMQDYSFIPNLDIDTKEFWGECTKYAEKEKMDKILAYMYLMLKKSRAKDMQIKRESFVSLGENIEFFPGVIEWFKMINDYAKELDIIVEHYVISSGLKEIISGSAIAKEFKKIYACEFLYDVNGIAVWPKMAVNYTAKTQFLFRINKGILDVADDTVNELMTEERHRIPFRNMIYIGDGLTDIPCMKLVKQNGGKSIAVFQPHTKDLIMKMLSDKRVDYVALADYREGQNLAMIIKNIIKSMDLIEDLRLLNCI